MVSEKICTCENNQSMNGFENLGIGPSHDVEQYYPMPEIC